MIKAWYREDEWPEGKWAAYQVKLDMGQFIYAPIDQDKVCRAPVDDDPPPMEHEPMEPEAPKEPMTWDEIKAWDSCVYTPKTFSSSLFSSPLFSSLFLLCSAFGLLLLTLGAFSCSSVQPAGAYAAGALARRSIKVPAPPHGLLRHGKSVICPT